MSVPFWICATVTTISAFVSLGFTAAALRSADQAARTTAMYATARSLALAAASVIAIGVRSDPFLEAVASSMIIVQGLDAAIGVTIRDRIKTLGPACTAVANLGALIWLLQHVQGA